MPVALSLTGRVGGDAVTLTAAEQFQRDTDWHELRAA
jgi:Asp-tRNA(Asn)/Glu-tRNA(Gln) amidotransferase A subunit family amidase